MSDKNQQGGIPDLSRFLANRDLIPWEKLQPYVGQYVAWTLDGTRIVASAPDRETLGLKLQQAGFNSSQVVHEYVDNPELSFHG
ncbi:MAG: hypothetical protein JO112_10920 [Planctomycetes bacterium]|nr:hypothetical protein [Planctomycetota bacterium]